MKEYDLINIRDTEGKSHHLPEMNEDEQLEVEVDCICTSLIVETVDIGSGKLKPKVLNVGKGRFVIRPKEAMKLLRLVEPDSEAIKIAQKRIETHFKKLKDKVEKEFSGMPSKLEEEWEYVKIKEIVINHRNWTKEFNDLNGRPPGNLLYCKLIRKLGLRATPENQLKSHRTKMEETASNSQSLQDLFAQMMEQNQELLKALSEKALSDKDKEKK